jgi:hypothetical protein
LALARVQHRTYALVIDRTFLLLRTVVKAGAAVYGIYKGHEMIEHLANGRIDWNAVAKAIFSGQISNLVCLGAAAVAAFVAVRERNLRRSVTAGQAEYVKKLEQIIDPHRSSSKLLPDGGNRGEDK